MNTSFEKFKKGMGIGGWLTNYKRFNVLPMHKRMDITVGDIEHFETYITESDVANIASMGLDHIRLGFDQIVMEEKPYEYRKLTFELIDCFIGWCKKYGLGVVLNLHKAIGNYCDIAEDVTLFDSDELQNRFIALWLEFEKRYASDNEIAFELLNEVRNINPALWNNLAEKTVNAIRKVNPERIIIIGSTSWNSPNTLKDLKLFDDPNIVYTFHTYDPFEFTHQQGVLQQWPLYYNRKLSYPCSDIERYNEYYRSRGMETPFAGLSIIDRKVLENYLASAIDFKKSNPEKLLWCGEFGTIRHANINSRENWMRDVISILNENGIPYCVWNYLSMPNDGNRFSLVDDDTRKILSERMLGIINSENLQ